ncbi:proline-, glutamic acid- and leucine-rich protein 1-like [Phalaenopsis equestris]|uniref:proline-, glutamic acid- and leucine-rich protein 1-like n=1 Tax=Phalaenopsis equestris TaxID=78828 RepID=UPI0009E2A2C2|nr:proline-, glutamic acid- and leucine-rich protein 1-like [Phalaenopsis equestris]
MNTCAALPGSLAVGFAFHPCPAITGVAGHQRSSGHAGVHPLCPRNSRFGSVICMAPEEEKITRRSPLDFPIEWERPKPGRRPDIFPKFSPMKTPLPTPLPADPPQEDEEEEEEGEKKEEEEEDPEKEDPEKPQKEI